MLIAPTSVSSNGGRCFGLENGDGQYNCYVNVVLQTLWHFESFRTSMTNLAISKDFLPTGIEDQFLIEIKTLIRQVYQDQEKDHFNINRIRTVMFKLFYLDGTFDLNQKGDASEAMICFLKLMHTAFVDPKVKA